MAQSNPSANIEKIQYYSQFSVESLQKQLTEEQSFQNRNFIRQVIRQKQKERDCKDGGNQTNEKTSVSNESIDDLQKLLENTTDYFEQCKIRSKIIQLKKKESKVEPETNTECLTRSISQTIEIKRLKYDELSSGHIMTSVIKVGDSVELLWITPFKILKSIECKWQFNDSTIDFSQNRRLTFNFDGSQAYIKLSKANLTDSGVYKMTINSMRLKRNCLKFKVVINKHNGQDSSSIIVEEPETRVEKVQEASAIIKSEINGQNKPKQVPHKSRYPRHKTLMGEEFSKALRPIDNIDSSPPRQTSNIINVPAISGEFYLQMLA